MSNKLIIFVIVLLSIGCNAQKNAFHTHYRTFGKGAPIVIINGGPGMNSNGFAGVAEQIAAMGFQTIIYDQRGTGKSHLDSLNNQTVTMDLMAEDLENLRLQLKLPKWTVMGHSFGGLLACHYLAKYPKSVEKMIFSSSGGVNLKFVSYVQNRLMANLNETQRDSLIFYQDKMQKGDTTYRTRFKRANFLANAYVFDKSHAPKIGSRLMEINLNINGLVFQDLNKIKFDYTNQFMKNKLPILVVQGANDIISVETAQEIKKTFGNAQIHIIENCAHYGWLDQPKVYFSILEQFLKH
jgi:proline iminopeptidase